MAPAVAELVKRGIRDSDARRLVLDIPNEQHVADQIEWFDELLRRMRSSIQNPAGFLFVMIRDGWPVPADFVTARKREAQRQLQENRQNDPGALAEAQRALKRMQVEEQYRQYREEATARSIAERFSDERLRIKLGTLKRDILARNGDLYPNAKEGWGACPALDHHAMQALREEVAADLDLLSFDEFCLRTQQKLFS
jgi:hypothetical protein